MGRLIALTIYGQLASKANRRVPIPRVSKEGKPYVQLAKSKEAYQFAKDAQRQIPRHARIMLEGPVRVTVRIYYATERPDLDESILLDVLQAKYHGTGEKRKLLYRGVYVNDRQVREKHVYHGIDRKNPRAEIEVEPILAELFERTANDPIHAPVMIGDMRADGLPF